jgi:ribose transport system substrate-binding protein
MRSLVRYLQAIFGAAVILAMAISSTLGGGSNGKIYYLIPTLIDDFQTESQRMIEGVFNSLNYEVISIDARGDQELQLKQLKAVIATNPAGIILNAVDTLSIRGTLKGAKARRIPVLVYDRMLAIDDDFDFASVADAEAIGQMAARKSIELLRALPDKSSKKRLLQIVGDPGDSYSLRVLQGFRAAMRNYKNIEVITMPAMEWEPANARKVAEEQQKLNPNIDVIFGHSADLAAAAIPLFEQQIKALKTQVIAITGAPVGLENLANGMQKFEIEQPLYAQVYGLAMGFQSLMLVKLGKGSPLTDGKCTIMGVPGHIKHEGKVLELEGRAIDADDLKRGDESTLWGNLARPVKTAVEIRNLRCEGR